MFNLFYSRNRLNNNYDDSQICIKENKIDQDVILIWTDTDNKKRLGLKLLILTEFVEIKLTPIDFEKKNNEEHLVLYHGIWEREYLFGILNNTYNRSVVE